MEKPQGVDINGEAISCPICTDILHYATETCCGHAFCEACIRRWLETNPTACPMCKRNPQPVHPSFTLRSICEQYHKKNPNNYELMMREKDLGNDFYARKQYRKAIEHYSAALSKLGETDNNRGVLYNNRSQCYIKLFQYSNALDDCEKAILMTGNSANLVKARMRKGSCLMHLGDLEGSLLDFELALQSDAGGTFTKEIKQCISMLPPPQELPNAIPAPVCQHTPTPSASVIDESSTQHGGESRRSRRRRRKTQCSLM